jgi:hypothetical protein
MENGDEGGARDRAWPFCPDGGTSGRWRAGRMPGGAKLVYADECVVRAEMPDEQQPSTCIARLCSVPFSGCKVNGVWKSNASPTCLKTSNRS